MSSQKFKKYQNYWNWSQQYETLNTTSIIKIVSLSIFLFSFIVAKSSVKVPISSWSPKQPQINVVSLSGIVHLSISIFKKGAATLSPKKSNIGQVLVALKLPLQNLYLIRSVVYQHVGTYRRRGLAAIGGTGIPKWSRVSSLSPSSQSNVIPVIALDFARTELVLGARCKTVLLLDSNR